MPVTDDERLKAILTDADTIAVVGCSRSPEKAAHRIPAYMQDRGYTIVPVNPYAQTVLGESAVDSVADVQGTIDVVNVFRPSEAVAAIAQTVIDRNDSDGDATVMWLQLGIHDDDAIERAEAAGIDVVEDRCLKVEHRRLLGQ
ncbi:MAG: CoA-binding protein [Halobacteriota archaeon]